MGIHPAAVPVPILRCSVSKFPRWCCKRSISSVESYILFITLLAESFYSAASTRLATRINTTVAHHYTREAASMAAAPEHHIPPASHHHYSTLEVVPDSTLETTYYSPDHPPKPSDYPQVNDPGDTTKEVVSPFDLEGNATPKDVSDKKGRRICGLSMKIVIIAGVVLLLVIIGAVVGGVVGTKGSSSSNSTDDPQPTTPVNEVVASTTPPTSAPSHISSQIPSSSTTSTRPTPTGAIDSTFYGNRWSYIQHNELGLAKKQFLEGSYDASTKDGNVALKENSTKPTTAQEWQLRPVPKTWANSTVLSFVNLGHIEGMGLRTYWIHSHKHGPNVRLQLDKADWASLKDSDPLASREFVNVELAPADINNPSQYWYLTKVSTSDRAYRYLVFCNLESADEWRLVGNKGWESPMMARGVREEEWQGGSDRFDVEGEGERIDPAETVDGATWAVDER